MKEPIEPKVEPQPTPPLEPVTPTIQENVIPQHRFNEVNERMKTAEIKATEAETELAKMKEAQREADEKRKAERGEFEELYKTEKSGSETLTEELKRYEEQDKKRWELLLDSIPEEKRKFFPEGESKEQINANIAKYDEWVAAGFLESTSIPSIDPRGNIRTNTPDKARIYFNDKSYNSEKEFMATSPIDYGKWLDGLQNLDNQPIGIFKKDGKEFII